MSTKPAPWTLAPQLTEAPELWRGCASCIPFWEGLGDAVDVSSTRRRFVANNGAVWGLGKNGRQASIIGSGGHFDYGSLFFRGFQEFSIVAFVKVNSVSSNQAITAAFDSDNLGWGLIIDNSDFDSGNTDTFAFHSRGKITSRKSVKAAPSGSISKDTWYILGATFSANGNNIAQIELFLNGFNASGTNGSTSDNFNLGGPDTIGSTAKIGNSEGFAGALDGDIAFLAMWNRILSDREMMWLAQDPYAMIRPQGL